MWLSALSLAALAIEPSIPQSADTVGASSFMGGPAAIGWCAPMASGLYCGGQVGGWARYGMTEAVDLTAKMDLILEPDRVAVGLFTGVKAQLVGGRHQVGPQLSIGGSIGGPVFGFNPLLMRLPLTVGYRVSPDVALYGRAFGSLGLYRGTGFIGTNFQVGGVAGAELSGVLPLTVELQVLPTKVTTQAGLALGLRFYL
jgi:hypothetical protein